MRGQSGVEFMLGVIVVLSFVLAFYVATFSKISAVPDRLQIEQLCEEVAVKIGIVDQYGDGFSQNVTMPDKLQGTVNYNIMVDTYALVCQSTQSAIRPHTATSIRNATGSGPPFMMPVNKTVSITNRAGTVVIT